MKEEIIAIPLDDKEEEKTEISNIFAKAPYFAIIKIRKGKITETNIIRNSALKYRHGVGPLVAKLLIDIGVKKVVTMEIGPTVKEIFEDENIEIIRVKEKKTLKEILKGID
ncbi:MAG: NifB/NifX family molybdenum-iron cluster-binding protein [Candidatus Verstraetearchaeota archaeon]|nr:NifB/NifX family molybdenum-iron cluster-binding protein [Candidatus Verstraetearchaeota archaeon]